MALHCVDGPALRDGMTIVLTGDGSKVKITASEAGYDLENDVSVRIGPDAEHELLQKVRR
jgi:hypothetical protein